MCADDDRVPASAFDPKRTFEFRQDEVKLPVSMNRNALKWKLIAWLGCTSIGAAMGLLTISLNHLIDSFIGHKVIPGTNLFIFFVWLLFGLISGTVGAIRMRPRVWG